MKQHDFIVLGAGVAGLAFAKRMAEAGKSVLILEKEESIGGLSRTLLHNDYYLDFCAHRFHTNNKELLEEVLALPEFQMNRHLKKSRIRMFNRYLKYPFELQNLLRALPLLRKIQCGFSFIHALILSKIRSFEIRSYKDWFVFYYGQSLYEVMCEPYTAKIWKTDPSNLSADWADQRFQGENLKKLFWRVLRKLVRFDFSSYSLEDDSIAPDGGEFYYPTFGIQELPNAFGRALQNHGGIILCDVQINSISKAQKTVRYQHNGQRIEVSYNNLITTIPLHAFYSLCGDINFEVEKALKITKYMDIAFVYVFLNKEQISNDHWVYFSEKDTIFNRAVEFKNWSKHMCPQGKTSVCLDITYFDGDETSRMTDEELSKRSIHDADRCQYFNKEDVESTFVFRIKNAYPFYDLNYQDRLTLIVQFLELQDTYLLGRTGIFRYNNSDNSIEMGFELANNFILNKKTKSIFEYNIKKISY